MRNKGTPHLTGRHNNGFTLIEVIVVLIMLGIVAVFIGVRFDNTTAEEVAAADTLKTHLRYAQLRAMGDTESWGISIAGGEYTLQRGGAAHGMLPGLNSHTATADDLKSVSLTAGTVTFSPGLGEPTGLSSISVGGQTITITAVTGFIP